jgi:hypothetical protein
MVAFIAPLLLVSPTLTLATPSASTTFADDTFEQVWQHTDQPVVKGMASRSLMWGPAPFKAALESYQEAPDGERLVEYFDKARMEITHPSDTNTSNPYYVTNGLLVREMISGNLQTGDNRYEKREPASVPVAGDPLAGNPNAPTYASFQSVASLNNDKRVVNLTGQKVTASLAKDGSITSSNPSLATYGVTNAYYSSELGHNIPGVFWNFMHASGVVYNSSTDSYSTDTVVNWLVAMGLPISEAYWARVKVGGVEKDVLMQAFERRVLTYTPSNSAAYQVEMGNVGLHYATWRYGYLSMLSITSPADGTIVKSPQVQITGHVSDPNAIVSTDTQVANVDASGNFSLTVTGLVKGDNNIEVIASTDDSNQEVVVLDVIYQP